MKMRKKKHLKRVVNIYPDWIKWDNEFKYYEPLFHSKQDLIDKIERLIEAIRENHPEAFEVENK